MMINDKIDKFISRVNRNTAENVWFKKDIGMLAVHVSRRNKHLVSISYESIQYHGAKVAAETIMVVNNAN